MRSGRMCRYGGLQACGARRSSRADGGRKALRMERRISRRVIAWSSGPAEARRASRSPNAFDVNSKLVLLLPSLTSGRSVERCDQHQRNRALASGCSRSWRTQGRQWGQGMIRWGRHLTSNELA
ncbi:hypothetical protein L1887_47917 [Cichorium endivia]|nr:hypothetical protein L1887_47917 [Cichorium endivia]